MLDFHDPPHARTHMAPRSHSPTVRPTDPRPKADSPPHSSTAKRCDSAVAKEGDRNSRSSTFSSRCKWARKALSFSSDFLSRKMSMISRRPRNSNCTRRLDRAVPHHVHLSSSHECDKTAAQRQRRTDNAVIELVPFFFLSLLLFLPIPFLILLLVAARRPSFCCGGRGGGEEEDDIWSIIFGLPLPRSLAPRSAGTPFGGLRSIACCTWSSVGRSSVGPRSPQSHPARGEMGKRS